MACPYCEEAEEEFTGGYDVESIDSHYAIVLFHCVCRNCGKKFKQKCWGRFNIDEDYENVLDDTGVENNGIYVE